MNMRQFICSFYGLCVFWAYLFWAVLISSLEDTHACTARRGVSESEAIMGVSHFCRDYLTAFQDDWTNLHFHQQRMRAH